MRNLFKGLMIVVGLSIFSGPLSQASTLGWEDGYPLDFPWSSIEGIWRVKGSLDYTEYYSFEVKNQMDGRRILKILKIDATQTYVLAHGLGFASGEKEDIVRAIMTGVGEGTYMLFIGKFQSKKDSRKKPVTMLRKSQLGSSSEGIDAEIVRVSKVPAREVDSCGDEEAWGLRCF